MPVQLFMNQKISAIYIPYISGENNNLFQMSGKFYEPVHWLNTLLSGLQQY